MENGWKLFYFSIEEKEKYGIKLGQVLQQLIEQRSWHVEFHLVLNLNSMHENN
jgi:predicted nuclease of restriction endonuclease-like RecB superfamily